MKIVNKHKSNELGINCMRGSPLGNPYIIGQDGNRQEVIQLYRYYLYHRIMTNNREIVKALRELNADSVLVCVCVPLECHCSIIEKAWHWAKESKLI